MWVAMLRFNSSPPIVTITASGTLGGDDVVDSRPGIRVRAQRPIEAPDGGDLQKPGQPRFTRAQAGRRVLVHDQEFRQLAGHGERRPEPLFDDRLTRFPES